MDQQLLQIVTRHFGLHIVEQRAPLLLPEPVPVERLLARLEHCTDMIAPTTNEKTRAEMIVAPILLHLAFTYQVGLYSGNWFNADWAAGLSGTVDHLFSRTIPVRATIPPPITAIIETKSRQAESISHCLVQLVAAQRWNASASVVYGAVTTGLVWRFLKLEGTTVTLDRTDYPLFPLAPLLALLVPMVSQPKR